MLHILDRNMRIKAKPEKFQESVAKYNVILTCEEKNYDAVVEHFESGESSHSHLAHVINLDIVSCNISTLRSLLIHNINIKKQSELSLKKII